MVGGPQKVIRGCHLSFSLLFLSFKWAFKYVQEILLIVSRELSGNEQNQGAKNRPQYNQAITNMGGGSGLL